MGVLLWVFKSEELALSIWSKRDSLDGHLLAEVGFFTSFVIYE
eukprot:SAG11_NODE_1055_length_6017_cov_1.548496_7_plen_43_part_00